MEDQFGIVSWKADQFGIVSWKADRG